MFVDCVMTLLLLIMKANQIHWKFLGRKIQLFQITSKTLEKDQMINFKCSFNRNLIDDFSATLIDFLLLFPDEFSFKLLKRDIII